MLRGAEILLDALGGRWRHRLEKQGSELDAMRAVVLPRPARLDELAGGNHRRVAENGDQIALTPAFTRSTQNPFSSLWKVTRSTSPPRTSVAVLVPARCPTVEIWS